MRPQRISLGVALALLAWAAGAQEAPIRTEAAIPGGAVLERDVAYLAEDRAERADLYRPRSVAREARLPAVVIIHGGGFTGGDKRRSREINIAVNLVLRGYVALSINYLLSAAPGQVSWPQNLQDCYTAVRWLRKHAARLHIDPERIGVVGGSAGGTLASLVTLTRSEDRLAPGGPHAEFSAGVRCGVDLYGPSDFSGTADLKMIGKPRSAAPELYRAASPVTYARRNSPPLLILHGTADTTVPVRQSERLAEALKAVGAPHELVIIPGAPHTFDLQPKERDLRELVLGFFDRHLKGSQPGS